MGGSLRLEVRASYDDGNQKDVTCLAKYTSIDETVASVDSIGNVTIVGPGEGAITVWYSSRIVIARVTSP